MKDPLIWKARPSAWIYVSHFCLSVLILGAYWFKGKEWIPTDYEELAYFAVLALSSLILLVCLLEYLTTSYELYASRLIVRHGILVQYREEVELYRVKDYVLIRTLLHRLVGLSSVQLHTSDVTTPELRLRGLYKGEEKLEALRKEVERMRKEKRVYEID